MKTITNTVLVALTFAVAAFAGQAQAHTEWRFSFKGGTPPYAVPHTHSNEAYRVRNASDCPRTVIRRSYRNRTWLVCPAPNTR